MSFAADRPVLAGRPVLADLVPGTRIRDVALVAGGAGLTGLAAQVAIHTPLSPVPFTLQTLTVLVVGAALGPLRGGLSIGLYALAGVAGVPWFAGHGYGWDFPAFGYVVGFVLAAVMVGALARRGADRRVVTTLAVMALGTVIVDVVGTAWLAHDLHLGAATAFRLGVRPFLATDAIKIGLAALAFPAAWRFARR